MEITPTWFAPPTSRALVLGQAPQLASWMAADHPDQVALREYLGHVEQLVRPRLGESPDPLTLGLDVRLPDGVDLLHERDLDNYAFPLVTHLARTTGRTIASVHVRKALGGSSRVRLETATERAAPTTPGPVHRVRTTASTQTTEFKREVAGQLAEVDPLPAGPVALELAYVVGPRRTWSNLWKPTIDALGGLLGSSSSRPWNPDDGRITTLALHRRVDPDLGHRVVVAVTAVPEDDLGS